MKIHAILFLLLAGGNQSLTAQDSTLLKKRTFLITAYGPEKTKTKGFLANIADTAMQVSDQPVQFARTATELVNTTQLNYNMLEAVRIKRKNGGLRGLGTGFICGFALGAAIGLASGNDKKGTLLATTAGEKALIGGVAAGILSAGIGAIIGALPGRRFIIHGQKENFDQLHISVLDRAYRNN